MARSPIRPLAARRRSLTGETYQQAYLALSELLPGTALIPAATPDLAALEALLLGQIGRCDLDLWHPGVLPFGITSLTPRQDRLTMRVPRAFLPDIIRQIMPTITDERGEPNVHGVIGLRVTLKRGIAWLRRPGLPGLIEIPATRSDWDRAVQIATDGWAEQVDLAWLTHPDRWHPGELTLLEAYPDYYAPGGEHYSNSAFASAILRRLPGMCPHPETTEYHNLWINMWPDHGYHVQLEWGSGPAHRSFLDKLLDPSAGLDADIHPLLDQSIDDCYADDCRWVRLVSRDNPRNRIDLRRSIIKLRDEKAEKPRRLLSPRKNRRRDCEARYGY